MADRSKRQKASDVFASTTHLFGTHTDSFAKAFPDIKSIKMVVEERGLHGTVQTHYFSMQHPPSPYVDCTNPRCYNGGYAVGKTLEFMVPGHTTHFEDERSCQGYEGSPKGRRRTGSCDRRFKVTVDLEFAPTSDQMKT